MQNLNVQILAKISVLIVLYILCYYTFFAYIDKTIEGDSVAYHIPIAKEILHGAVLNPTNYFHNPYAMYYAPGDGEAIVAVIMKIGLPVNIFNVIGLFMLFFASYYAGVTFGLKKTYAIIFSATICTLHTIDRWLTSQTIDLWLAVFFTLTLALLQKPEKKISYFLKLGFFSGLLIGTKYTGPLFFIILCLFYLKPLIKYGNIQRLVMFLLPFSIVGLFWYVRNVILTGDPYYPQSIPFFKGIDFHQLDVPPWKIILFYKGGFTGTLTAFFSEYTIWILSLPAAFLFLVISYKRKIQKRYSSIVKVTCIGLLNFIVYLFLPDGPHYNLYVSTFRYSYPALVSLILSIFLIFQEFQKEEVLSIIAILNMLIIPEINYYPKLLIAFLPLGLLVYFWDFNNSIRNNFLTLRKSKIQLFHQKKQ